MRAPVETSTGQSVAGTPDEAATVAALLMGPAAGFITGSDVLMDGGVTASYFFGDLSA